MVTPPPPKRSRFILHSPTWLTCFSFPEPLLFCTYSRPSEPGFRSASMEPSILVIYNCTAMHPILSTTDNIYHAWDFMGQKFGQTQPGIDSFHSTMTGVLAGGFWRWGKNRWTVSNEWVQMPRWLDMGPMCVVLDLAAGCVPYPSPCYICWSWNV